MEKHVLVIGGSGFLGKSICRELSRMHIPVISLSRNGKPPGISNKDFETATWIAGDVLSPANWTGYLHNCRGVIHCVGILNEDPEKGETYERLIFEAARIAGGEAKKHHVNHFVYISGGAAAPGIPDGYMKNKEAAETFLLTLGLKLAILKPGMLYGKDKLETILENAHLQQLLNDPHVRQSLYPHRPLPVDLVARVAIEALLNDQVRGRLSVDDMETLAKSIGHD